MSSLTSKNKKHKEAPFQCGKCGAKFTLLASLYMHDLRHKGERRFTCEICDGKFYSNGDLNRHIKSHNGVKEFQCSDCDKKYTRKYFLKKHIYRVHIKDLDIQKTQLKPHKPCKDCGKIIHPDSLRTHRRRHTGEKPYLCLHCITTYMDSSSIRQHMRSHIKEGQVFCRNCQAIFDSKEQLNIHVDLKHKNKNCFQLYTPEEIEKIKQEKNWKGNLKGRHASQLPCFSKSSRKSANNRKKKDQELEREHCIKYSKMQSHLSNLIKIEQLTDGEDAFQEVEIKDEPLDSSEGQVFCRNCQAIFDSEDQLKIHVDLEHENQNHFQRYTHEEIEKIEKENNLKGNLKGRHASQLPCFSKSSGKSANNWGKKDQQLEGEHCMKYSNMQSHSNSLIKVEPLTDREDAFQEVEIKDEPLDFSDTD